MSFNDLLLFICVTGLTFPSVRLLRSIAGHRRSGPPQRLIELRHEAESMYGALEEQNVFKIVLSDSLEAIVLETPSAYFPPTT